MSDEREDAASAEARLAVGRRRWPDFDVSPERFADQLSELVAELGDPQQVTDEQAEDLYLACACADGNSAAIRAFEDLYFGAIGPALGRMNLSPEVADEVRQTVRERLFMGGTGEDAVPGVLRYAGRGNLRALVKVAATRAALNRVRGANRRQAAHDRIEADGAVDDPMLSYLKDRHRKDFKAAFETAVDALETRQRNLLRLSLIDRLSIDEIASIYQVHRSTAARWLQAARDAVSTRTREALAERLNLDEGELEQLFRLVQSQLDLSVSRVLRDD